jgi:DNA topoisomerase-1
VQSLAIPPAWRDVWISEDPAGHVQACGRDARGRKQCLYHARWREARDEAKYSRMKAFGQALPALRAVVARDLRCPCLCEDAVIAAIVTLMDRGQLRIGCEEYSRSNGSHGACTLTDDDVRVKGATVRFRFVGKSGVKHTVEVKHARLAKVVARCRAMRGPRLFQYEDENGEICAVTAKDVNAYLRAHTSGELSAKDFRTWHATALCKRLLPRMPGKTERERKRELTDVIAQVAEPLGNTPTVCRKSYIDPELMATYLAVEAKASARTGANRHAGARRSARAGRRSGRGRGRPSTAARARRRRRT